MGFLVALVMLSVGFVRLGKSAKADFPKRTKIFFRVCPCHCVSLGTTVPTLGRFVFCYNSFSYSRYSQHLLVSAILFYSCDSQFRLTVKNMHRAVEINSCRDTRSWQRRKIRNDRS